MDASPLPPTVRRLGWISFLVDVASEMLYPLIPVFVSETLGAPGKALGWIEGAAEGTAAFTSGVAGVRSDRLKKRVPFVRLGYALSALSKPLLALAYAWPAVLALRVFDRIGKGVRTAPRDALIADVVAKEHRGRAYGFHRSMDTAGAFVGVLCALGLLAWLGDRYRLIFALAAVPALIAVAITFTLREPAAGTSGTAGATSSARAPARFRDLPARFWTTAGVLWLFALGNSSDTFLLLRAKDQGFSATTVVLAYALYNLVYSFAAYPAGALSDRVGRKRMIALGLVLFVGVYAGFAALGGAHLWWLFALYGVHMGLVQGVASALIADAAPSELKATAIGAYRMGVGFATLTASVAAGYLWDEVGHAAPFWFGAAAAALACLALLVVVLNGASDADLEKPSASAPR
ncbi:MAG: MFS transporter [Planctomycetes bacterium]|nr:MFS transporter [Planctomycetota bacterium]